MNGPLKIADVNEYMNNKRIVSWKRLNPVRWATLFGRPSGEAVHTAASLLSGGFDSRPRSLSVRSLHFISENQAKLLMLIAMLLHKYTFIPSARFSICHMLRKLSRKH